MRAVTLFLGPSRQISGSRTSAYRPEKAGFWAGRIIAEYQDAIKVYREGINVNPLLASLHYSLGLALEQEKKTAEAEAEIALARKIDPNVGAR